MAIDKTLLDSIAGGYKFYLDDMKNRGVTGEHYNTVENLYNRILELGEECTDMNQMYAKMQNENIVVKMSEAYTKALTEEGNKKYASNSGSLYDDSYLMKNNLDALRNSIQALRDNFDNMLKNATPSQRMRILVEHDPQTIIKSIEDMIALAEQPGMTYPNFLRLQIEQGLDKAVEGVMTRQFLEKTIATHKALMSPELDIRMWEEKLDEYNKTAALNKFNIVDMHEWELISDGIERKYQPEREKRTKILDLFSNILEKIDQWAVAYCKYPPHELMPWNTMPYQQAINDLKRIQKTFPGIIKEFEKQLDKYFGLKFTDIVDNTEFRHHVEANFIDDSQALVEFLINEVYPHCKPFCDLPDELVQKREQLHRNNCEGNPGRLEPYLRLKRHYNDIYGEEYMEKFMNEIDLGKADKAKCNSSATPWNYDTFLQNTKNNITQ